jgi:hypothetical protein
MIGIPKAGTPITQGNVGELHPIWRRWFQSLVASVAPRLTPTDVKTAAYTAKAWELVLADPTSGGFTINLPNRASSGSEVAYKNTTASTNAVTFAPATGHTIDSQSSVSNNAARGSEHLVFDAERGDWARL